MSGRLEVTEAEDLVQDTIVRALQAFPRLQDPGAVKTWLFRIMTNLFTRTVNGLVARLSATESVTPEFRRRIEGLVTGAKD